ncbi:MAG: MBL fold metallo-hydrolase [Bacilli bacterium]
MFTVRVLGCWGAYPAPGEATSGYLLEIDGDRILVDCGSGVLSKLFEVCPIEDLRAVILSHHHYDHAADLGILFHAVLLARLSGTRTRSLPIFMPEAEGKILEDLQEEPLIDLHIIGDRDQVRIGGNEGLNAGEPLTVEFRRTKHPIPCFGLVIRHEGHTLAYSADSAFSPDLIDLARAADLFICEASLYDHQADVAISAGHCTAGQAGEAARLAGARRLALTHFPQYGSLRDLREQAHSTFGKEVEMASVRAVWTV